MLSRCIKQSIVPFKFSSKVPNLNPLHMRLVSQPFKKHRYYHNSTKSTSNRQFGRYVTLGLGFASAVIMNHYITSLNQPLKAELSIDDVSEPELALKNKTTFDLVVALIVYKLCAMPFLIDATPAILNILDKLYLTGPVYFIIKRTIFKQFCGGEKRDEITPLMHTLKKDGVGSILDFSIEADLEGDQVEYEELREYANKRADNVTGQYVQAVQTASTLPGSFVALKVTGLVCPILLEKVNNIEHYLRNSFILEDKNNDNIITTDEFKNILKHLPGATEDSINRVIENITRNSIIDDPQNSQNQSNKIDWIDYCEALSLLNKENIALISGGNTSNSETNSKVSFKVPFLNEHESQDLERLVQRLSVICQTAFEHNVRLMIDAEQSYFQAAIDLVANDLALKYNRLNKKPIVFNTYQLYLKESLSKLCNDLIRAKRNNSPFGAKLVRGAYMVNERKRAEELGLPHIIQDTIEHTHKDYNTAIDILLNEVAKKASPLSTQEESLFNVQFMIASHNTDSVLHACNQMEKMDIKKESVMFGQLYGMKDYTTFALSKKGFNAYKYIPYGPIKEVMPYLIRRAQENSTTISSVKQEEYYIKEELKKRWFGNRNNPIVEIDE